MSTETPILLALKQLGPSVIAEIQKVTGIHKITLHQTLTKMHKNGDIDRNFSITHYTPRSNMGLVPIRQFVWSLKQ